MPQFDIFVQPFFDEVSELENRNLNLTWNVTNFEEKDLVIQIQFQEPTVISIEDDLDKLIFKVKGGSQLFRK